MPCLSPRTFDQGRFAPVPRGGAPSSRAGPTTVAHPRSEASPCGAPVGLRLPLGERDTLGFELGWDHARYGVAPCLPLPCESSSLLSGMAAGRAMRGARPLPATRPVQLWLRLRLQAWARGCCVEPIQVTPRYLEQLETSHCPVTRAPLDPNSLLNDDAVFAPVRQDAAYAAGNLAVLSAKAQRSRQGLGWAEALEMSISPAAATGGVGGLSAAQWARAAVLGSFVEPLTHEQACTQPLLVLPPNRLRLMNSAQALQAFISRQLLAPGWSLRMSRIEALLPARTAQRALQTFFHALLPRVLEAGRNPATHELRWAIEDAWRCARVQQRWLAFARQLSPAQCEALVVRAHAKRLGQGLLHALDDRAAVDGWGLARRGRFDGAVAADRVLPLRHRGAEPMRQARPRTHSAQRDLLLDLTA
jgi:hypothetical protein